MQEQLQVVRTWLQQGSINLFGMPFAGKDTQGQALADLLGAELMGGGQILRNSVIPADVKEIMHRGDLIPTEDFVRIVLPYLCLSDFAGKPLMLSSVGRWDGEQYGVLQATEEAKHPMKAVVLLTIDKETARARHQASLEQDDRGDRTDDSPEVFDNRLDEFASKTLPVIEFYRQKGLLIEVDGSKRAAEVTEEIIHKLHQIAAAE